MIALNENISIVKNEPIINSKASETYVSVIFQYDDTVWEGYVPIEYRRTGTNIDFDDKEALYNYLNYVYEAMRPEKLSEWKEKQSEFWATKPRAHTTKAFYDQLENGGWQCGSCKMPRNPNPQRRIQELKEVGYTIATDLSRYCPHCQRKTSQRILLPIPRGSSEGNGYETWTQDLREKIIRVLGSIDVYEATYSPHCLPDHKFSEIRWDEETKAENPNNMTDSEIKSKFQLLTNQRNQQKREVCRECYQTGKRGVIFGIPYFYKGGPEWDDSYPKKGKGAEQGCEGCPWYDIEEWRAHLIAELSQNED